MLLPTEGVMDAEACMVHGQVKHPGEEWKTMSREEHIAHLQGHWDEYLAGVRADHESGLSPLAHLICRASFLSWKDKHGGNDETPSGNL